MHNSSEGKCGIYDDDGDVERRKTGWLPGGLDPRLAVGLRKRDGWAKGRGFMIFGG